MEDAQRGVGVLAAGLVVHAEDGAAAGHQCRRVGHGPHHGAHVGDLGRESLSTKRLKRRAKRG